MEDLIKNVEYFINKHKLKKRCRKPRYVHRRMYFWDLLRKSGMTYQDIGKMFGQHHATIIYGIKKYNQLRSINDKLLLLDIACYDGKFKVLKKNYNLKNDILKATTIRDLDIIKSRTENNLYKELF
jgi:hypothetical protein